MKHRLILATVLSLPFCSLVANAESAGDSPKAVAAIKSLGTGAVSGVIHFEPATPRGTRIWGELAGLAPGKHGFHVHQFGDCSAPDGTSAGGHFNPTGAHHGGPTSADRHVGDLGNIEADTDGKAKFELTDATSSLTGEHSLIGHSVIVHEKTDDLTTDPAGNAGPRIACGVIGYAK